MRQEQILSEGKVNPNQISENAVREELARVASLDDFYNDIAQIAVTLHGVPEAR